MESSTRQSCEQVLTLMSELKITLQDLFVLALLKRREELFNLQKQFPDNFNYADELKEVRNQLLEYGE